MDTSSVSLVDAIASSGMDLDDELCVQKCESIATRFSLTSEAFAAELDAFMVSEDSTSIDLNKLSKFETLMQSRQSEPTKTSTPSSYPSSPSAFKQKRALPSHTTPPGKAMKIPRHETPSPGSINSPYSSSSPYSAETYQMRQNSEEVVLQHNKDLDVRGAFNPSRKTLGINCEVSIDPNMPSVPSNTRFMFTPVSERAKNLDKRLDLLCESITQAYNINQEDLQPVSQPLQSTVIVCGRICREEQTDEESSSGPLSSALYLEGSRKNGNTAGVRLLLDFSSCTNAASLFPGQVAVLEGINASGRKMNVTRIIATGKSLPPPSSPRSALTTRPLMVTVASGPFDLFAPPSTTNPFESKEEEAAEGEGGGSHRSLSSGSSNYQPLQDILLRVLDTKPDVLVLCGPFVDASKPHVRNGGVGIQLEDSEGQVVEQVVTYDALFAEKVVREGIEALFNSDPSIPTQIILVPSLSDAFHTPLFPQPPIGDKPPIPTPFYEEPLGVYNIPFSTGSRPRVHCVPNPCLVKVNEVVIGISTQDILLHLSSQEVSIGRSTQNRITRLCSHLLQQQSFYPLFPPPPSSASFMDLRHIEGWSFPHSNNNNSSVQNDESNEEEQQQQQQQSSSGFSPDLLILPSRLNHFVREVEGTLCVNPGTVVRGLSSGGTYAEVHIHPPSSQTLHGSREERVSHKIPERTRVDIKRI